MSSPITPKPSKPTKTQTPNLQRNASLSSSSSSHLATIELKQKILTSLSKLSDRDTHQIGVQDLETTLQTLPNDSIPILLSCLYDATSDPKPPVKKESLRLLATALSSRPDSTHLTKAITHIVKRLKDADSGVRDTCKDAIGSLSAVYLKGPENGYVVSVFAKPLFEAMGEQNKNVQGGAAMCAARMVECAGDPPVAAFQKMCPRICKFLNSPNFLAKSALLPVVSSLSQAGAIAPQTLESLLQCIHDCLGSSDWATRKAAADTLTALALYSSNLISDGVAPSTVTVLEACRFDKIKPVRDSMTEALQLWKKIAGNGDGVSDDSKNASRDGENTEPPKLLDKMDQNVRSPSSKRTDTSAKDSSIGSPLNDVTTKGKSGNILDKAVGILKKKAPALTEKELNPEFFEKLEKRRTDDLPVEVIVPRQFQNNVNVQNEGDLETNDANLGDNSKGSSQLDDEMVNVKYRSIEKGNGGGYSRGRDLEEFGRDKWGEERGNGKDSRTNWLAIQRQLLQMERQQAHLMNMLQDFMGGSHDSMVTLENRVRGLERIVEDMARDLSLSSSRRGGSFMAGYESSSNRPPGKYNGFSDYPSAKFGRNSDGWAPYGDRYARGPSWRSDGPDNWDFHAYGKNGQLGSRRGLGGGSMDVRSPKADHVGPVRLGEGPSARSVWQNSKDEATLEAIRVAGEDKITARRVAVPEMVLENDDGAPERDPIWTSWSNAMDALRDGDVDSAYGEVLSTGDDLLLVKLMDKTGAVVDQLSNEVAAEILHAVAQFLQEQNLFDVCLFWIQQLTDIVGDNGPDVLGLPIEVKREILVNLHETCSTMDPPEDWEGTPPDQLLLHLASAWDIDIQHLDK